MLESILDYELLDFGHGRKFERFGDRTLIRPHPAAARVRPHLKRWAATAEFLLTNLRSSSGRGSWKETGSKVGPWTIAAGPLRLQLKLTSFGHVGLFPEHFEHWRWLEPRSKSLAGRSFLNLFAYTGALSLLLASSGARVTHVDSSSSAVRWARKNAELSGTSRAAVRWITDDALRFVRREIRRGVTYDGFIVDPPSFGRGPRGESWKIDRDLGLLLSLLRELGAADSRLIIVSAHTPGFDARRLNQIVHSALGAAISRRLDATELFQWDRAGRRLEAGSFVRA